MIKGPVKFDKDQTAFGFEAEKRRNRIQAA